MAQFEGYTESAKAEFEALEEKLSHDLDRDFEYFDSDIRELLASELLNRYYYQRGSIVQAIKSDSMLIRARHLLLDAEAYGALLRPTK